MTDERTTDGGVRRYEISEEKHFVSGCGRVHVMEAQPDGDYVRYDNHAAALAAKDAEIARLNAVIAEMGEIAKTEAIRAHVEVAEAKARIAELELELSRIQRRYEW